MRRRPFPTSQPFGQCHGIFTSRVLLSPWRIHCQLVAKWHGCPQPGGFRRRKKFDAIHVDTVSLHAYRAILPEIPATLTHHNIESHMMVRRAELEPSAVKRMMFGLEARRLIRYERSVAPSYDAHIVCSALDADRLKASYGRLETVVVPNAVDIEFFSPQNVNEDRSPSLVFAGNMSWYPNRDAMLHFAKDIWPILKDKVPTLVMNLVGAHTPPELISFQNRTIGSMSSDSLMKSVIRLPKRLCMFVRFVTAVAPSSRFWMHWRWVKPSLRIPLPVRAST